MGITLILAVTGPLVLQEGPPSRDPKVSSCLTLGNESSKETRVLTKPVTTGKGRRAESTRVREPGGPPCHTAAVSGFMLVGLVSKLSLASHLAWPMFGLTQGPSLWPGRLFAKMDSSAKDSGRLTGHMGWCLLPLFEV